MITNKTGKVIKMKAIKRMLQQKKVFVNNVRNSGLNICGENDFELHLMLGSFNLICRMFHLDPKRTRGADGYDDKLSVYLEGIYLFCLDSSKGLKRQDKNYWTKMKQNEFGANCYTCEGNKEKAFEIFLSNNSSFCKDRWIKDYKKLECIFRKNKIRSYESLLSDYGLYRHKWIEDEEIRGIKYDDYNSSLTLKQFISAN
jgi:hypothetical protein